MRKHISSLQSEQATLTYTELSNFLEEEQAVCDEVKWTFDLLRVVIRLVVSMLPKIHVKKKKNSSARCAPDILFSSSPAFVTFRSICVLFKEIFKIDPCWVLQAVLVKQYWHSFQKGSKWSKSSGCNAKCKRFLWMVKVQLSTVSKYPQLVLLKLI